MSTRRLFAGLLGGVPRLRISRAGTDAKTAADGAAGILFDSNWSNTLPIHDVKTITTPGSVVTSFDVTWTDLGYIPLVKFIFDRGAVYASSGAATDIYRENYLAGLYQHSTRIQSDRATFRTHSGGFPASTFGGFLIVFRFPSGAS